MPISHIVGIDMGALFSHTSPAAVGRRIKLRREQLGMTQVEVAAQAGINQSALSSIELGNTKNPEAVTILRLAVVLKTNPYYLMWDHQQPGTAHDPYHDALDRVWPFLTDEDRARVSAYAQGLADSHTKDAAASRTSSKPGAH